MNFPRGAPPRSRGRGREDRARQGERTNGISVGFARPRGRRGWKARAIRRDFYNLIFAYLRAAKTTTTTTTGCCWLCGRKVNFPTRLLAHMRWVRKLQFTVTGFKSENFINLLFVPIFLSYFDYKSK